MRTNGKQFGRLAALETPKSSELAAPLFIGCCRSANLQLDQRVATIIGGWSLMYLSNQSLSVIVVVGIVAGWLAGKVVEGGGFGLIWDLIVGLIGAFIGDWLLPRLGIHLGARPDRHRGRAFVAR
jgi:uncharacterized membrane protein YeaQ/YmgE (transglycosylase-associated protein family)